jgi:DNA-binding response OmpR family regulator
MVPISILVADDEQDLVWAVRHSLCDEGYDVLTAHDGLEAMALACRHHPDLIVLDVVMPGLDGLELCRKLRRDPTLAAVAILFLTEHGAVGDRVAGLDAGGDDYLAKPFDLRELKARIKALLRRHRPPGGRRDPTGPPGNHLVVGTLTLDLLSLKVRAGSGATIQLTRVEADLLAWLMRHAGQLFSSQQLLEQVWGYPPGVADPSLVRWHIKNLRAKIELDPTLPQCIHTVSRQGYILEAREGPLVDNGLHRVDDEG